MEYTIAFTFTADNENDTLNAQLNLSGDNLISLLHNQSIQIQSPYPPEPSAPLVSLEVKPQSISMLAGQNQSGNPQSVKLVVPIKPGGSALTGNFPFSGVQVRLRYQFIGYSSSGNIAVGDFSIPFPS
ncbi:hypothetical protein [Trinickia fusca]|uniref:Uncharacterized protein n=1 Tax=Trinickia fusca TaxID=2419777 RepID=A0A494XB20_9BURK|nr:hypothetical protein [Trinickia fusca]RKP46841.1 hypothetical protein D7S89_15885 [Trinickia fusca]